MALDLTVVKATSDALKALFNLGRVEVKHVKDELGDLLTDLSRSLKSLWDVTNTALRLEDKDFHEGFPGAYQYFKSFYYAPEDIERARTHCSDLERHIKRIQFKLGVLLHTDIGQWGSVNEGLWHALLNDQYIIDEYKRNFEVLNSRLSEVNELLRNNKRDEALAKYRSLRTESSSDLDELNECVKKMRAADTYIRETTG